jgi:two-component system response regulator FixJ
MAQLGNRFAYIVDDDDDVRDSMAALLESADIAVRAYASGRTFLKDFDSSAGGCIILDLHMPGLSGFQVLDTLQARGSAIPVLLFSGRTDLTLQEFARRSGAVTLLTKPVAHEELIALVRSLLAGRTVG